MDISLPHLVFLLSMFLSKKETEQLRAYLKGFKGKKIDPKQASLTKNSLRFMAKHRIFSDLHYKGFRRKIRTVGTYRKKLQENIQKYTQKKKKSVLSPSEKGKVALWLANDLKRFMVADFKKEWKGYKHSELQRCLAFYNVEREYLKTFLPFQQMNFTEDMKKAFAQKNLDDFYDRYLSARISQIRGLVKNLNSFTKAKELKPFYKQSSNS